MKKIFLFFFLLLAFSVSHLSAQQIPFQGRLLENGVLVNGQRNFTFSINIGNINWTESHPNEVVTNGLYALVLGQNTPLPSDLFEAQNSVPLAIQVNGQSLPTTTLYAPFESDPTVLASVKDGVDWEEVSNKPTVDTSFTNELQHLSVDGDSLSISGGNKVELPTATNPTDSFRVGMQTTTTTCALEQLVFDGSVTAGSIWQSFSLIETATLQNIQVNFANLTNVNIRFRIYPGEGISGQFLYSFDYAANNFTPTLEMQTFDIASNATVELMAGEVYTFYIEGIGDDLTFRRNSSNPYTFGRMSVDANTDAIFKIIIEQTSDFSFEVTPTETVVGNTLLVKERIEDKTGFVMPVGTIVSYGGATAPKGWLLCNGEAIRRDLYTDLFTAIGTNWGEGDGSSTFNLPDLRGQFLRGVADTTSADPDKLDRISKYSGGNTGNNVGSYQEDEFREHRHASTEFTDGRFAIHNGGLGGSVVGNSWQFVNAGSTNNQDLTGQSGGAETRPQNAYVNYIIKY